MTAPQPSLFADFADLSAPRLPMDEWVERHRYVVGGAFPGKWDPRRAPMSAEPMAAMSDDRVKIVCVVSPAQLMKTEFAINCALWTTWYGEDLIFFEPELGLLEEMISDRIRPAAMRLRGSGEMAEGDAGRKKRDSKTQLRLPSGGTIYGVTPMMKTGDAARAARIVVIDEMDKMGRTDMITVSKARSTTFGHDAKIATLSTPTEDKLGTVWRLWSEGSRGVWHGRCPHCHELAGMGRGAVKFDSDASGFWLIETMAMACDRCGVMWSEAERLECARNGRYVHRDPDNPIRSFLIPGPAHLFRSLYDTFEQGAADWRARLEELDPAPYRKWINDFMAEPWNDDEYGLTSRKIARATYTMGAKGQDDLGELDHRAIFVTAGTDIGGNAIYTEWVAWGVDPATRNLMSWGLQYRTVGGGDTDSIDEMDLWIEYDNLLRESMWRHPHAPGALIGPQRVLIDAGWGQRYDLVRDWCTGRYEGELRATGTRQRHPWGALVLPAKSHSQGEERYEFPVAMNAAPRKRGKYSQYPQLVNVMSQALKDQVHEMHFRDSKLPEDIPKCHGWPDPPEAYGYTEKWRMEFSNFKREGKPNRRTRSTERHWVKRVEGRDDEALDCRVLALAAAHFLTNPQPLVHGLLRLAHREAHREGSRWSEADRQLLDEAVAELDGQRGNNVTPLR